MEQKKVVIIGAGFGGIYAAKALAKTDAHITILDKQNHHLFQPLLYQVAAGILSAGSIATPIRAIIGKNPNTFVRMEEVIEVDRVNKVVKTRENEYPYDQLIMGTGSTYDYFGNDHWKEHTFTLKTLKDAVSLRNHIFTNIEQAFITKDPEERKKLLSFVVIGGGPTGVETAGVIAEVTEQLTREEIKADFSEINIYIIEAMDRLLGPFDPELSEYTKASLEKLGVKVKLKSMVREVSHEFVRTDNEEFNVGTIVWAAGVKAIGAPALLSDIEKQRNNRVKVNDKLQLVEDPNIFLLGDCSFCLEGERPLPGLGSVAKQQGVYLGQQLKAILKGKEFNKPFKYSDLGVMATIGRAAAVAQFGSFKFTGFFAWLVWSLVHVMLLISFRNRFWVLTSWVMTLLHGSLEARNINNKEYSLEPAPAKN